MNGIARLSLLCLVAGCVETTSLTVNVRDPTDEPVADARVVVGVFDTAAECGVTDDGGHFTVTAHAADESMFCSVLVKKQGFEAVEQVPALADEISITLVPCSSGAACAEELEAGCPEQWDIGC